MIRLWGLAVAGVLLWTLWSSAALWIDGPTSRSLAAALAATYLGIKPPSGSVGNPLEEVLSQRAGR
jgi:hypothetical protein